LNLVANNAVCSVDSSTAIMEGPLELGQVGGVVWHIEKSRLPAESTDLSSRGCLVHLNRGLYFFVIEKIKLVMIRISSELLDMIRNKLVILVCHLVTSMTPSSRDVFKFFVSLVTQKERRRKKKKGS